MIDDPVRLQIRSEIISRFLFQLLDRIGEQNPKLLHWLLPYLAHDKEIIASEALETFNTQTERGLLPSNLGLDTYVQLYSDELREVHSVVDDVAKALAERYADQT